MATPAVLARVLRPPALLATLGALALLVGWQARYLGPWRLRWPRRARGNWAARCPPSVAGLIGLGLRSALARPVL